ncbi:MAG: hypothetical protein AAF485_24320, partial [Chloroflexota bacterium]
TGTVTDSNIVTHQVITNTVQDIHLPIVLKNYAEQIDLTIVGFSLTPIPSNSSETTIVTIVVQNQGTESTDTGFWVDLYLNPTTTPDTATLGADRRWSNVGASQGMAWPVSTILAPGESITLTTSAGFDANQTVWSGTLPVGTNNLYAFADSFDSNDPTGATNVEIVESNETNNMSGPLTVILATGLEINQITPAAPGLMAPRKDIGQ